MSASDHYIVVSTGDIVAGFDRAEVEQRLQSVLHLQPAQAAQFFNKRRVVKKGLTRDRADRIRGQLAGLGVNAEVQRIAAATAGRPAVTTPPTPPAPAVSGSPLALVNDDVTDAPQAGSVECPKCRHKQAKSEQCSQCGIWFHKFEPASAPAGPAAAVAAAPTAVPAAETLEEPQDMPDDDGALSPTSIAAAAAAAVFGAWLWKFVAVTFDYELGLIAWAIGGAVGYAAATQGSRGVRAGVVCSVLALGAIVVGKYWAYSALIGDFQQAVSGVMANDDAVYAYFEEEQEDAALLVSGSGSDAFLRGFMVERGYTDAGDPARVTAQELEDFRTYTEPALRELAETSPDFEQWQENSVEAIAEISPWTVMKEESGGLDILFALLGIGTAFRLGSQMS